MNWNLKSFEELSNTELYHILQLRSAVFVVEQNCVYLDLDGDDKQCFHLFALNALEEIICYCRIVPPGLHYTECSIGRVISNPKLRKSGAGKLLMQKAIEICKNTYPNFAIKIGAQHYLQAFYESFGFIQNSAIYDEDGIPHLKMVLQ